jgi:hypothetical protein
MPFPKVPLPERTVSIKNNDLPTVPFQGIPNEVLKGLFLRSCNLGIITHRAQPYPP